jgi:para-nitrobenzyl esterase
MTPADYETRVRTLYGRHASAVLELYPLVRYDNPYVAFREVAADSNTVCPGSVIVGSPPAVLDLNQQELSHQMMAHWSTFARTGDPTADRAPVRPHFDKSPESGTQ